MEDKLEKEFVLSYKFHIYRKYIIKRFFPSLNGNLRNIETLFQIAQRNRVKLLVWSTKLKDEGIHIEHPNIEVVRLEDGFIRSVGLGVIFTPPISLVADKSGIYFDSTSPSDLEKIINSYEFDQDLIERAKNLINMLKEKRINKYNIKMRKFALPKTSKKIILVVGQVETDKSIKYGSPVLKTNIDLLESVRKIYSDEFIVYKPHPDVSGGYRKGSYPDKTILKYADYICKDCDNFELMKLVDEVHVINSLFGFEALMWGKKVVCYGQPFYGSWGLTTDIYPVERRKRRVTFEQLFAAVIILYPMYVSLINNRQITPEEAIFEIEQLKFNKPLKWKFYNLVQTMLKPILKLRKL